MFVLFSDESEPVSVITKPFIDDTGWQLPTPPTIGIFFKKYNIMSYTAFSILTVLPVLFVSYLHQFILFKQPVCFISVCSLSREVYA